MSQLVDLITVSVENFVSSRREKRQNKTMGLAISKITLKKTFDDLINEKERMKKNDNISTDEKKEMINRYNTELVKISDEIVLTNAKLRDKRHTFKSMMN